MEERVDATNTAGLANATTRIQELDLSKKPRLNESIIQALLFVSGAISIFTTLGIVWVLVSESSKFFLSPDVTLVEFWTGTVWQPQVKEFSIWPLLISTLRTSTIGLMVAIPLGLGAAIYLSEYATPKVRATLKPILEILAGVPTVVYGYFALNFVTQILRNIFNQPGQEVVQIFNTMSAGLVIGVLVTPLIASMSEDALSAVPNSLRQAAYGLGSTKFETATRVVLPAALSGVLAAMIVAMSRAVGETMIAAIAAGAGPKFTFNPFLAAETMTGHIARISGGDLSQFTIDYQSIFAVGIVLFGVTLILNVISNIIVARFREVYE